MQPSSLPWHLADIDLDRIDAARVRDDDALFLLLCSASFVESGSDRYSHNLVEHFAGDDPLRAWLAEHWEHEELQHGRALAAYVTHVWPEVDWPQAFAGFWHEYEPLCVPDELEADRGLELAARCVVETGTASMYRALHALTDEPMLRQLTELIRTDEVRHYKYFYQYFRRYRERESLGRMAVLRALVRRVRMIRNEDGDIAMRHAWQARHPERADDEAARTAAMARAAAALRRHTPATALVRMLLKPMDLPARLQPWIERPAIAVTAHLLVR